MADMKMADMKIPILRSEEDLPYWSAMVRTSLGASSLIDYIEKDIPEPTDSNERIQWQKDRAIATYSLLQSLQDPKVRKLMEANGWTMEEKNPKVTFETAKLSVPSTTKSSIANMLYEFNFTSTIAYVSRAAQLHQRLEQVKVSMEDVYLSSLLNGLCESHSRNHDFWKRDYEQGDLTWEKMMAELSRISREEEMHPAMVNIDVRKQGGGVSTQLKNNKRLLVTCTVYSKRMWADQTHRECGHHAPKDLAKICWWCNPEKAPEAWR
ncbi:hypothetical protein OQA88_13707 [Cercophora sp. LCS_1]